MLDVGMVDVPSRVFSLVLFVAGLGVGYIVRDGAEDEWRLRFHIGRAVAGQEQQRTDVAR